MKRHHNENGYDPHENEPGVDRAVREALRDPAVPEDVEGRLRGRLSQFRRRLNTREERESRRFWWAVWRVRPAFSPLFIYVSAVCSALAVLILFQGPKPQEFLAAVVPPTPRQVPTYLYDPTNGTVSAGDIWRVRQGGPVNAPVGTANGTLHRYTGESRSASQLPAQRVPLAKRAAVYDDAPASSSPGAPANMFRYNDALVLWDSTTHGVPSSDADLSTESYDRIVDNAFLSAAQNPLSTFSIDVDTASYSNVRRMLMNKQLPPPDAVRIEELINYFPYEYPQPEGDVPFSATTDVASCPWAPEHRLVRIGLKGREIEAPNRPACNLVFLLDVSGSMNEPNKLPLLKDSFKRLVDQLQNGDRVAIVVYAGASGLVLPSTPASNRPTILEALDRLQAGVSTNGASGIQLAYDVAAQNFIAGGANRVILATDGDFNVGVTDRGSLTRLIEDKAKTGVFLTVLGFGMGNLKDATLEELSRKGNGNYAYIDDSLEAHKVLVEQVTGTLVTIAKDVKIQVEFNPAAVASYRLVGYENRLMAAQDFNDDRKDAGEIGAGQTVTALYEIVPAGGTEPSTSASDLNASASTESTTAPAVPPVDALKYQKPAEWSEAAQTGELLTLKLRYKAPDSDTSQLLEFPVADSAAPIDQAAPDFQFAVAVAGFGMILRHSEYKGNATYALVRDLAKRGLGSDSLGYRAEFIDLLDLAESLSPAATQSPQ